MDKTKSSQAPSVLCTTIALGTFIPPFLVCAAVEAWRRRTAPKTLRQLVDRQLRREGYKTR